MRHPLQLMRIAGLLACLNSALGALSVEFFSPQNLPQRNIFEIALAGSIPGRFILLAEIVAYIIYGLLLWRVTRPEEIASPQKRTLLLIAVQMTLTLLLFSFDVFYMVAAELGLLFPLSIAGPWILAQSAMETAVYFTFSHLLYWMYPPDVMRLPRPVGIAIVCMTSLTYYSLAYVKNHVSSILSKLGARDRTRAVLRAIGLGYL